MNIGIVRENCAHNTTVKQYKGCNTISVRLSFTFDYRGIFNLKSRFLYQASDKKSCVMYHIFPTEDDKYFLCVFDSAIWQRLGSACCV